MRIIIQNFRHYTSPIEFEFETGKISLLNGASGQGKSTVLMALMWCLFGGLRGTHLKPAAKSTSTSSSSSSGGKLRDIISKFGASPAATVVILELPGVVTIRRRAAATASVEVEIYSQILQSDAATAWINSTFGTKNLWTSSSYISQGGRNPLLSLPNADKFSLLYELTFSSLDDEGPEPYIKAVAEAAATAKATARAAAAKVAGARDSHESCMSRLFEKARRFKSDSRSCDTLQKQLNAINRRIDASATKASEIAKANANKQSLDILRESLRKSLSDYEAKYKKLSSNNKVLLDLSKLKQTRDIIKQNSDSKRKLKTFQSELNDLKSKYPDIENFGRYAVCMEMIEKAWGKESSPPPSMDSFLQAEAIADICETFKSGCCGGEEILEEAIKTPATFISFLKETVNNIQTKSRCMVSKNKENVKHINEMETELEKRRCSLKECPKCGYDLYYYSSSKDFSNYSDEELEKMVIGAKCSIKISSYYSSSIRRKHRVIVNDDDDDDPIAITKLFEWVVDSNISDKLNKCVDIVTYAMQKGFTSTTTQLCNARDQFSSINSPKLSSKELHSLGVKFRNITESIEIIEIVDDDDDESSTSLSEIDAIINECETLRYTLSNVKNQIDLARHQLLDIENSIKNDPTIDDVNNNNIENNIQDLRMEADSLSSLIESANAATEIDIASKRLATSLDAEATASKQAIAGADAVAIVARAANKAIADTVNGITEATNIILGDIFPDDAPMSISLDIVNKTVSLSVYHRMITYEGPSFLSGGEMDRLSMALTIAMSMSSRSPIVLLDECMSSLDGELREQCFEALRRYIGSSKTVVNVCHEAIEGHHDNVVNIIKAV